MLVYQFLEDLLLGVFEICRRGVCGDDTINDLDALSIILALLYPPDACEDVSEPFTFKILFGEDLFDHIKCQ